MCNLISGLLPSLSPASFFFLYFFFLSFTFFPATCQSSFVHHFVLPFMFLFPFFLLDSDTLSVTRPFLAPFPILVFFLAFLAQRFISVLKSLFPLHLFISPFLPRSLWRTTSLYLSLALYSPLFLLLSSPQGDAKKLMSIR